MKKIGKFIVKARYALLAVFAALVIISGILMTKVKINYDMTQYLDKDSSSSLSLEIMQDEFGSVGQCQVMVYSDKLTFEDANALSVQIEEVEGVASVVFTTDPSDSNYYKSENGINYALYKIFLTTGNYDTETYDTLDDIRGKVNDFSSSHYSINSAYNGGAVSNEFLTNALDKDMVIILIIVAVVVLAILTIVSSSWIEPLIFLVVCGGAILINMGTNILLNYIPYINNSMSFITKSIAAVMQLALSMDYAIVLLHAYKEKKQEFDNKKEAMAAAIAKSIAPVSSSSLTTVAGLVALMFMSFSIGFDVGLVLAKGIIISLLSVFLFMPAILLIADPLLVRTSHKTIDEVMISYNEKRIARFKKHGKEAPTFSGFQKKTKYLIPAIAAILILVGAILNFKSDYSFVLEASTDKNATVNVDDQKISDTFGTQNTMVVLIPKDKYTYQTEQDIITYLTSYQYSGEIIVNSAQGLTTYGINIPLPASMVAAKFNLPEAVVSKLYEAMGKEYATVEELIDFLNSNQAAVGSTVSQYCTELQAKADNAFDAAKSLNLYNADGSVNLTGVNAAEANLAALEQGYALGALTAEQTAQYMALKQLLTKLDKESLMASYPFFQEDTADQLTAAGYCYNFYAAGITSKNQAVIAYGAAVSQKLAEKLPGLVVQIQTANASLKSENYIRVIFNMNMAVSGEDSFTVINDVTDHIYSSYDGVKVVSETFVYSQIKDVFNKDIVLVNLISFFAILLIIAITFKGYFVPVLLTALIQGAIWITMGISTIAGQDIFFICYIVVMCVQMGATIDYAILLTTNYKENRKTMNRVNAMGKAMNSSLLTIFTSGSILILATLIIGLVSKVKIISDLGLLLSRGCAISVFSIIFCLPQFLILFDRVIEKTTFGTKFYRNDTMEFDAIEISSDAASESPSNSSLKDDSGEEAENNKESA